MSENNIKKILAICASKSFPKRLSQLIAAQAMLETSNFKSKVFLDNKNAFGYKYVKGAKYQLGAGRISTEQDPYANYANIEDSTREVCDWIFRRQREGKFPINLFDIQDAKKYATLLKKCGYFGAPLADYIRGVDRYVKEVEKVCEG